MLSLNEPRRDSYLAGDMRGICQDHFDIKTHYVCAIAIAMVTVSKLMAGEGVRLGRSLTAGCANAFERVQDGLTKGLW